MHCMAWVSGLWYKYHNCYSNQVVQKGFLELTKWCTRQTKWCVPLQKGQARTLLLGGFSFLSSAVTVFLSPQNFQLPTLHAGWCSSAVILCFSPQGFQVPVYLSSAVTLSLSPQGSHLPSFCIHKYTSAMK